MNVKSRLILLMCIIAAAFTINFAIKIYHFYVLNEAIHDLYKSGPEAVGALHKLLKGNSPAEDWKHYLTLVGDQDSIHPLQQELINSIQGHINTGNFEQLNTEIEKLIDWNIQDATKDYQIANSALFTNMVVSIILFILTIILSIISAIIVIRSITNPLDQAVSTVNQLALGDTKLQIESQSKDEFGILFDAMNKMNESNKKVVNAVANFSKGDLRSNIEPRSERDVLANVLNELIDSSKKMRDLLSCVADGDLTVSIEPRSEYDTLGLSLVRMTKNLKCIVRDLQNEVATLTTSSQEIVGSVSEVATGSNETATAVAETTTSVEELKQTAHISDAKAKEVLSRAEETTEIVSASEKSLNTTINDMGEINQKMKIISSSIVALSDLSQTIREIIDSVNDLAEQSNVLAVNAAIEAAKAGEHGKSFSVVAGEIRLLAEQSKSATIQVRLILNDIQKATSEAVLATEQGAKAADKGLTQSTETFELMQKLSQSMAHVAELAGEIVASSGQQLIGVDQVTIAMNNISQAAAEHVSSMKQIETAVISLNSVGNSLKGITEQYRLDSNELKHGKKLYVAEL